MAFFLAASWLAKVASAAIRSAFACVTLEANVLESMVARMSPGFTSVLKSTFTSSTWPESWEPTLTVTRARTGPDVDTILRICPLDTGFVS